MPDEVLVLGTTAALTSMTGEASESSEGEEKSSEEADEELFLGLTKRATLSLELEDDESEESTGTRSHLRSGVGVSSRARERR